MVMAIAIARRTYHVHEDVADHEHRDLVVLPGDVELLEEVLVVAGRDAERDATEVLVHDLAQAVVELVAVLVEHHVVGIAAARARTNERATSTLAGVRRERARARESVAWQPTDTTLRSSSPRRSSCGSRGWRA